MSRAKRDLWQRAAALAARKHMHTRRDDGQTPYFSHPARVALTLVHVFGCDDDQTIAAALLHDTIEDTDLTYGEIAEEFGPDVADTVAALTRNALLPDDQRDEDYLRRLAKADWRTRLIKLADEYDNYTDTLLGIKEDRAGEARKAREILDLVRDDARKHDQTARAVKALKRLLNSKHRRS